MQQNTYQISQGMFSRQKFKMTAKTTCLSKISRGCTDCRNLWAIPMFLVQLMQQSIF